MSCCIWSVGQRDVVAPCNVNDLGAYLVVGHLLRLIEHELQIVYDGGRVHAAYLVCKLAGDGKLLCADKLRQIVQLLPVMSS